MPETPGIILKNNEVVKILYDIGSSIIYIGYAPVSTSASSASWLIKKISLDGSGSPTSTLWSGATAIWDNRASETYT